MDGNIEAVVAGGGRVGLATARRLDDYGHDVVVVESDPDRAAVVSDAHVAMVYEGDATDPDVLRQTGVEDADVVGALTGETGTNVAVCTAARELAGGVRTVARINRETDEAYEGVVDTTVYPETAGARIAATEMVGSDVGVLAEVTADLDILQVRVAEGAPAAGKTLQQVRFPTGTLVISSDEGSGIARPDTVLEAGRRYVVAVEPDVSDEVMNLLRG
jgi:trk system potassium uptake protein TrkA